MNLNSRACIYNLCGKLSVIMVNFLICKKKRQTDNISCSFSVSPCFIVTCQAPALWEFLNLANVSNWVVDIQTQFIQT